MAKLAFIDTEFTGEHAHTTLVSVGIVTLDGSECYVTLNDYDKRQVTPWLQDNVLNLIDPTQSISGKEAYQVISNFLEHYSQGEKIHLISAGLGPDLILTYELWKSAYPDRPYFHSMLLPDYLNHAEHYDLNTLFSVTGHIPSTLRRPLFAGILPGGQESMHNALFDAKVVKACFLKLIEYPELKTLKEMIL